MARDSRTLDYSSPPQQRVPAPSWSPIASATAAVAALGALVLARSGASQAAGSEAMPLAGAIEHFLTLYVALPGTVVGLLLLWPGFRLGRRTWAWWLALELNVLALVWATIQLR